MDFVQTYQVDIDLCELITSRITIPDDLKVPSAFKTDIEEFHDLLKNFAKEYFCKISEFNYFAHPQEQEFYTEIMHIQCIPPWNFVQWDSERAGSYLNCYIFLKDTDAMIEFFNPFLRKTVRFKGKQGLCIVVPSVWMFIKRFTNTFESHALFISAGIGINDFNNVHKA